MTRPQRVLQRQHAANPCERHPTPIWEDLDLTVDVVPIHGINLGLETGCIVHAHTCLAREYPLALPLLDLKGMRWRQQRKRCKESKKQALSHAHLHH